MKIPELHLAEEAMKQYAEEEKEYNEYVHTEPADIAKIAGIVLDIRGRLSSFQKSQARDVLSDAAPSRAGLAWTWAILDENEFLSLPSAMVSFLHDVSYNILDDGFMGISRVEVVDDHSGRTAMFYAIWTGEQLLDKEQYIGEHCIKNNSHWLKSPRLISCSTSHIKNLDQFVRILETLASPDSYDAHDWLKQGVLDFMFHDRKAEEQ